MYFEDNLPVITTILSHSIIEVTWPNSGNKWWIILKIHPFDLLGEPRRLLFGSREVAGGADNDKISLAKYYVHRSGKKGHF